MSAEDRYAAGSFHRFNRPESGWNNELGEVISYHPGGSEDGGDTVYLSTNHGNVVAHAHELTPSDLFNDRRHQ